MSQVNASGSVATQGRILIALVVLALQSGLIAVLLMNRAHHARSMRRIRQLNRKMALRARDMKALFDVAPVGIVIAHDRTGRNITANAAFERLFPGRIAHGVFDAGPLTYHQGGHRMAPAELPMARAAAESAVINGEEFDVRHPDGRVVSVLAYAAPVVDQSHTATGYVGAFVDLTEHKRAEREAQEQRRELAHLSRVAAVGELSGALAHELSQPLTAILANAQAAQRLLSRSQPDLQVVNEILTDIARDDLRAAEVIRRVRALMRNEPMSTQPIDLNEVVHDVLQMMRDELLLRGVDVRATLAQTLPAVLGDRIQLQQVLLNLLMNACDAMTGAPAVDCLLQLSTSLNDQAEVQLCVSDRGPGIPMENLESVFQPFYTSKHQGLGLGLTICRSIVTNHQGRLWAINNPDCGATFIVTVPALKEPVTTNRGAERKALSIAAENWTKVGQGAKPSRDSCSERSAVTVAVGMRPGSPGAGTGGGSGRDILAARGVSGWR